MTVPWTPGLVAWFVVMMTLLGLAIGVAIRLYLELRLRPDRLPILRCGRCTGTGWVTRMTRGPERGWVETCPTCDGRGWVPDPGPEPDPHPRNVRRDGRY